MLERTRETERVRGCVAPVEVERDLGPADDRVDGGLRDGDLARELRSRDRPCVQVLVLEERQVEIELERGEATVCHLPCARRIGLGRVHVARVVGRPVHLRLRLGELVDRVAHPGEPP